MNRSVLNADGTITIQSAKLTAHELDQFIQEMLMAREQMQPPVPNQLSRKPFNILVTHDPHIEISRAESGEITLALGTPGQWCVFTLPDRQAALVRDTFAEGLTVNIIADERGGRLLQ